MNEHSLPIPEELEALLREAATDPRSTLLRVERPRRVLGLFERQSSVPATVAGLSLVERHLLDVYRDELADLLRRACLVRLFSEPAIRPFVHRSKSAAEDFEIESQATWSRRARVSLGPLDQEGRRLEGLDLIERCAQASDTLGHCSITQLARASQRLQPTDWAEAWVAFDLVLHGQHEVTARLVPQILAAGARPSVAAACLEYLGLAESMRGDPVASMHAYRSAFHRDQERATPLVGWMHMAIRAGQAADAERAGRILDELVREALPGLLELFENYGAQKRAGFFLPTREGVRIAKDLSKRVGPLARRVTDVHL